MERTPVAPAEPPSEASRKCVTCGQQASGQFCAYCGEKRRQDHDFSLSHILGEAVEAFFHVDSKVFGTLKALVAQPGKLTEEFFLGRRRPYMSPLQTFFVCNLLFFVLQPLTGLEILAPPLRAFENNTFLQGVASHLVDRRLAKEHISRTELDRFGEFTAHFDRVSRLQAKSLILIMSPMLAVFVAILNFRRHRYFSEHLVFALHVYAWWLLWLLLMLIIFSLLLVVSHLAGRPMNLVHLDRYATLLEFGGLGLYAFYASRRFYRDGLAAGFGKGILLAFCGYGVFLAYRAILFFTVIYSV